MKKKLLIISSLVIILLVTIILLSNQNEQVSYAIPRVYFEGDISNMNTKEDERNINIKYVSDDTNFTSYAKIKIQGTSSIGYEKKNYTINLYKNSEYKTKNKIDVGWGKQSKYCLKANWIDKTHARNIVTAQLVSDISKKYNILSDTPNNGVIDGFPVEIYINGEFLGLYTWNIPKDAWMFNMDEENENHIVFVNEGWSEPSLFKEYPNYGAFDVEAGRGDTKDLEKLNRLSGFIINSTDKEFKEKFDEYLNKDAAINYFIMLDFAELIDNTAKNMLLATYDGKIWYPTLYDLDTSWGTMYDGRSTLNYEEHVDTKRVKLWERLEKTFPKEIAERYFELRENILTKENILNKFNDFKNSIPKETYEKEQQRWSNIPGYEISQIEEFLETRIPIIDKIMEERLNK